MLPASWIDMSGARSMYERAMGEQFQRLPDVVQKFHRLAGKHVLHGEVQTDAPSSALAKLMALCLGTPTQASGGKIRFELDAASDTEIWTRYFPSRTMTSRMRLVGREVVEQLGPARLAFEICEMSGTLQMRLQRLRFVGIPCPQWLLPRIVAEETADDERFCFRVQASLPIVGVVASYRGYLILNQY
jgi:hypothetical protein